MRLTFGLRIESRIPVRTENFILAMKSSFFDDVAPTRKVD